MDGEPWVMCVHITKGSNFLKSEKKCADLQTAQFVLAADAP